MGYVNISRETSVHALRAHTHIQAYPYIYINLIEVIVRRGKTGQRFEARLFCFFSETKKHSIHLAIFWLSVYSLIGGVLVT